MNIKLNRGDLLQKLSFASRFSSAKLTSLPALQGIYIKGEKNKIHFYASNLNSFFHSTLRCENTDEEAFVIEPKKIIEFISFLPEGKINLQIKDKQLYLEAGKTRGRFALMEAEDFPLPPKIDEKKQKIKTEFFKKNLPFVLFSASPDETRPALSGINFLTNGDFVMVATDGFRLSLVKTKKDQNLPSIIIPAEFLKEINQFIKEEKEVEFSYSEKEKMISFKIEETELFSRLVEGDFPPFEKVIPQDKKTTIKLDREELLRNVKLIAVFARDYSNIIVLEASGEGLKLRPKIENEADNSAHQEIEMEGEDQKVAFNYKFILDFLNTLRGEEVVIEILRTDAPVVFKSDKYPGFLHIIMPVRIQE